MKIKVAPESEVAFVPLKMHIEIETEEELYELYQRLKATHVLDMQGDRVMIPDCLFSLWKVLSDHALTLTLRKEGQPWVPWGWIKA